MRMSATTDHIAVITIPIAIIEDTTIPEDIRQIIAVTKNTTRPIRITVIQQLTAIHPIHTADMLHQYASPVPAQEHLPVVD